MAARASQLYFRFRFLWFRSSGKVEIYMRTKFRRDISIHCWDITTSGFWKQTSAMLECYFRFRFLRLRRHRHTILYTKFCQNRTIHDGVMTSYPFFHLAARPSQFYFWFRFSWFRRSKSTCIPNFHEICQSTAEILQLPVSEYKRPPCWNSTTVPIFTVASLLACHSASAYQISSKSDHSRRSYDVISIFQDGGQGIAVLLPVSVFVISLIWEGRNLPVYQISVRYLNPRLRYYYFRFLKTNVRHVGILLPVPIFMSASPSACHFASVYQISSKSDHLPQSYVVILIFST